MAEATGLDRRARAWFVSPALATALFFVAQIYLAFDGAPDGDRVFAAAADAPVATPVRVHMVAEIREAERAPHAVAQVPNTEQELLSLFKRDGSVTFFSDEVEVVTTPAQEFKSEEAVVITADKLRRAKLATP